MEKKEFLKVLEASILLFDNVPEEKVINLLDKFSVNCAKYINGFLKSYKN